MEGLLTPENTMLLDRLIRTTRSEHITFDSASGLAIQLLSPSRSHYTIVKLDPLFFQHFRSLNAVVSVPARRFYRAGMKSLRIVQGRERTVLEYEFEGFVHTESQCSMDIDLFDLNFTTSETARVDLSCIRKMLKKISGRLVRVEIGEDVRISGNRTVIRMGKEAGKVSRSFLIENETLRSILSISDLFSDSVLAFSADDSPLNIIFRSPPKCGAGRFRFRLGKLPSRPRRRYFY